MLQSNNKFMIFGHRGLPGKFTENSLKGFMEARASGLDGIELDVQLTKDNEAIIYHDYTLSVSGENKHPWDLTLAEIKEITLPGGESIPTLGEVLRSLEGYRIIVELKTVDEKMERVNRGIEEVVNREISAYNKSNFLFVSFDPRTMMELKGLNGSLFCGWNVAPETIRLLGRFSPDDVRSMGLDYLQPSYDAFTDEEIKQFIKKGIPLIMWTVNSAELALHLKGLGVSGIITDDGIEMVKSLR